MILRNKLTKETLNIPYSEFRKKFAKEIQRIFGRRRVSVSEPSPQGAGRTFYLSQKHSLDVFVRQSADTPNNPRRT